MTQKAIVLPVVQVGKVAVAQNHKLSGSSIVECSEIEEARTCKWFDAEDPTKSPLCPGCFAAKLFPVRNANHGGKKETPRDGLIRLGTWRETTAEDYEAFTRGHGARVDGSLWVRPDFPKRAHFVVTRGLEDMSLYAKMAANPRCLNIQVSVDVIKVKGGSVAQIPSDERLKELVAIPKVLLRFKTLAGEASLKGVTYDVNTAEFIDLQSRLGVDRMRVLETPLRISGNRSYGTATPLEVAGWDSESFLRCNTECNACPSSQSSVGENKVLGCAVTPIIVSMLQLKGNADPPRVEAKEKRSFEWTRLTLEAWRLLGGHASLQDLYAEVKKVEPDAFSNPYATAKIRAVVQGRGERTGKGVWRILDE